MMTLVELRKKIEAKTAIIGVVGLGYVGLAVACKFAGAGFPVLGLERQPEKVTLINDGILPMKGNEPGMPELLAAIRSDGRLSATTDPAALQEADVILVAVETPVAAGAKSPNYEALKSALTTISEAMQPGALVIIESTIAPGTMAEIVRPLLEEVSGLAVNKRFYLGHCPERVMPGRLLKNLSTMSRVCGGNTPETAQVMAALYRHIVQADLDLASCATAEMVKTTENAYRDVQIAFANEIALICEMVGADVWEVRELVNKSPQRDLHMPGAGVGGHCIPKDPWLLVHSTTGKGAPPSLIPTARQLNDNMPLHMADLLVDALFEVGYPIRGAKVAVLGYAYLENTDDVRNSPSERLINRLQKLGAHVVVHDPYVAEYQGDLHAMLQDADAIIVMVAHQHYKTLNLADIKPYLSHPILIDGRRVFEPGVARQAGFVFRGVGRGEPGSR